MFAPMPVDGGGASNEAGSGAGAVGAAEGEAGHPLRGFCAPPAPHGLGLCGNEGNYYDAKNSLLHEVLSQRRGIPITLCLLHAAVGRRVGLAIHMCGMPMRVFNWCVRSPVMQGFVLRACVTCLAPEEGWCWARILFMCYLTHARPC